MTDQKIIKRTGIARIIYAGKYSLSGIIYVLKTEPAFRQVFLLNLVLIILAFFVTKNTTQLALLMIVSMISIIVELFNTAIEAVVDRISLDYHPLSKVAKDLGSAAQFFALILLAGTWLILFI